MNDGRRANGGAPETRRGVGDIEATDRPKPKIDLGHAPLKDGRAEWSKPLPPIFSKARQPPAFKIKGRRRSPRDLYHWLLTTSWGLFAAIGLAAYLFSNTLFAGLYLIDPHGISGARPGNFADAFFFSVETIGTIGYGVLAPRDLYANIVMTGENFFGLSFIAVATGVIFARVSRPTARVMFSKNALITQHDGALTLMFRAANERANRVLEAEVTVSITRDLRTLEGKTMRRFEQLNLVRSKSPLFALTWTVLHIIDESSPLFGVTEEALANASGQILVVLSGMDETFAQRIHARHSYMPGDIVWNRHFADVIFEDDEGGRIVDYGRFHDLEDLPEAVEEALDPVLGPEIEPEDRSLEAE
jgi:inward rectifier potassium channel